MTTTASFIAANRFALGLAPGEERTIDSDPRGWVQALLDQPVAAYTDGNPDAGALVGRLRALGMLRKDLKENPGQDRAPLKAFQQETNAMVLNAIGQRFSRNVSAENGVQERLVLFWSNHFSVSSRYKHAMAALMPALERDAIRPHILGRFEDMLLAVEQHPAMLLYLDNAHSVGPDSVAGQRRKTGLNENLGREALELHTLGVNGGYTQGDVTNFSRILTGWTIDPPQRGGTGAFKFEQRLHEPGAETLLGKAYAQPGIGQGVAAFRDLARRPATAHFIATKLARHFTRDDPDPADVAVIAGAFQDSGGDLRAVLKAVAGLPSVWAVPLPKVKTPYELLVSMFRGLGLAPDGIKTKRLVRVLGAMDNRPFNAPSPAGWPDRVADWVSSSAVMTRIEWCHVLARRVAGTADPYVVAQTLLGPVADAETLRAIRRAPSAVDGFALLLSSPEFQRR